MGLSNGASKARNYTQTNNQDQAGGPKKAGLKPSVGNGYLTAVYRKSNIGTGHCCKISQLLLTANPAVCVSRPIGSNVQFNTYFNC